MKKDRLFWGILFIIAGVALLISKIGLFPEVNAFTMVLTFLLVVVIGKSLRKLEFAGIFFPLAFIAMLYDNELGITNLTPWTVLLTALLSTIGFSMVFGKSHFGWNTHTNWKGFTGENSDIDDAKNVRFERNFSGSVKYINSDQFENADIECNFGGMKVYFDNARMSKESATVRLSVNFSGVELYVPKEWRVVNNASAAFGAIHEKNSGGHAITNTLILVGDVNFAGVEIYYV